MFGDPGLVGNRPHGSAVPCQAAACGVTKGELIQINHDTPCRYRHGSRHRVMRHPGPADSPAYCSGGVVSEVEIYVLQGDEVA